jgi:hypothetical protein
MHFRSGCDLRIMFRESVTICRMPWISGYFHHTVYDADGNPSVDPAFIKQFYFNETIGRWQFGCETREITCDISRLAYHIVTAYVYNHPEKTRDEVMNFLQDCFVMLKCELSAEYSAETLAERQM